MSTQQVTVPWVEVTYPLSGNVVYEHDPVLGLRPDGTGLLSTARRYQGRGFTWWTLTTCDTRRPWMTTRRFVLGEHRVAGLQARMLEGCGMVTRAPRWRASRWGTALRFAIPLVMLALIVGLGAPGATPLVLLALWLGWQLPTFGRATVDSLATLPLDSTNVAAYAAGRLAGKHPETLEEEPHRLPVLERMASIRERYGALQADVVYRIDHPALFDGSAPHTARFLAAMVAAQDLGPDTPVAQLEEAASKLEVAFAVAKRHAEAVGIAHLPEAKRDDVARASKIAKLARDAGTDGERTAALVQLNRVLGELAVHYLPPVHDPRELEAPR